MHQFCHRCGGELPAGVGESAFCPHCGAPQLRLSLENQSAPETAAGDLAASTGAMPPPRPKTIVWKAAIRSALFVAAIAALLSLGAMRSQLLSSVTMLWVFSASLVTMSLYQRAQPSAWMDVRVGARIGVVVGLCLALALGASTAGWGLISRYVLHSMAGFDAEMAEMLKHSLQQMPPDKAGTISGLVQSPEFRGGLMAAGFATMSVMLLLLSTVGGAFAGLLRMRRGPVV